MSHTVCLIPGDGIGPEVAQAARRVIDASGAPVNWLELPAGAGALETCGEVLPDKTVEAIEVHRVALKGPITTPIGKGFRSVNVQLRKRLNLYAAVRPVRSLPGVKTRYENVELVVIRENTEGLYSGLENEVTTGVVQSLKIATRTACERIARFAFNYARERRRHRVTVFHKANIMKLSDGLFLDCAREIHEKEAPDIAYDELIIDNGCMHLVRDPGKFDILLLENLYGDVVSDLCAGLVGGLGVVPGANIGDGCAVFEAVHGSAPDIAGKGVANPLALIMSGVMMLNHLGETAAAKRIKTAYDQVLRDANPGEITPDIGGQGTTESFAKAVISRMECNGHQSGE
ncbi:MAG TPA: isocitrate/isopropylmalate dehydrogenase family protein [Candidatus Hydrogenedentes bacterium]|nr:isocitrate/isopropylmalate dehydrogenase family protein [Candidatus Hydrogenedentota bacterium]HQE82126.1 isocitrate/isopropylmalate dehydrogenase family protein [Candidatus Hydrogenedentota bacterium]HQH52072.1 isocitrate/isopropylmalate dehydrogenase family protein [Candidatus Hydrogenedentota bacterium]HQM49760.1 isocitrate/isopropylmalate dehydrogenase family protein [Candidatus Hydrogenedentota bacterium]